MKPPLVVFDLDGVLVDLGLRTESVRTKIRALFRDAGVDDVFVPLLASLDRCCREVASRDSSLAAELGRAAWSVIDAEELRAAQSCQPREGVSRLLATIDDLPLALYSNNCRAAVLAALASAGIDDTLFCAIHAREHAGSLKPSGTPILAARQSAGGESIDLIYMVGDQPVDMEAALAAQVDCDRGRVPCRVVPLGVLGRRSVHELEAAGAWFLAADLAEVADLVMLQRRILAPPSLSIVLLAFNEVAEIEAAIVDARRFCRLFASDYEVIVVDDGSSDDTASVAGRADEGDVRVLRHATNLGMGASMRDGYLAAQKDFILHLPADRQVRPQALARFLPHVDSRTVVLSQYAAPPSGRLRKYVSSAFRGFVQHIGGLSVDFAGTYVFHRRWLESIALGKLHSDTFLFSFELLEKLVRQGCRTQRVTIHSFSRSSGVSREFSLGRAMSVMREILKYRWQTISGLQYLPRSNADAGSRDDRSPTQS